MLWDCPEEPGARAVLLRGEVPERRAAETREDDRVSEEEFAAMCAKRKNQPANDTRTDLLQAGRNIVPRSADTSPAKRVASEKEERRSE